MSAHAPPSEASGQLIYLMGLEKEIDRLKDKAFDKVAKRYEEANP